MINCAEFTQSIGARKPLPDRSQNQKINVTTRDNLHCSQSWQENRCPIVLKIPI
jgi:hypothetical protein